MVAFVFVGCTTASLEDAMPQAAAPQPPIVQPGQYPNLNVTPQPAATQLTESEKLALTSELRARRTAQAAEGQGSSATSNSAELRRLGATHAQDALKVIEGN